MDDVAWVSQGPPLRQRVLSVMLLLHWAAMGANLSWRKGKYGQRIDWMGTMIAVRPLLAFTEKLSLRKGLVDDLGRHHETP